MHEKGLVVCCMFDCIPRGTYFIPSDNAVIESLVIQPAFITYLIYLYYFYKFNESKINHFLLLFAKGELLGGRQSGVVNMC